MNQIEASHENFYYLWAKAGSKLWICIEAALFRQSAALLARLWGEGGGGVSMMFTNEVRNFANPSFYIQIVAQHYIYIFEVEILYDKLIFVLFVYKLVLYNWDFSQLIFK